jgi:lambda family phage portal protein
VSAATKPHVRPKLGATLPRSSMATGDITVPGSATTGDGSSAISFAGASLRDRALREWRPARRSADGELLPELSQLVARQRDLERNSGVAHSAIQTHIDNVVGTGLRLSSRPNYIALGKNKEWAQEWGRQWESIFHGYWWSTACDAGATMTGDQMAAQVLRSSLTNGDWLILPLWLDYGDGWMTKLQTIDSDRLSNANGQPDSLMLRGGVHFNEYGAPTAYDIQASHPTDFFAGVQTTKWLTIPRYTDINRRYRVLHGFDPQRPAQSRGKPLMSAVLGQFKQIDRYTAAEISAAVANALIAGIIYTDLDQDSIVELFKGDAQAYLAAREKQAVQLESGSLLPLFPGDKMESFIPTRPAAQFENFVGNIYRIISVGCDLPKELLLKDWTGLSYSSSRTLMLEAWRSFNRRRDWMGTQMMDPIHSLVMEEAVDKGLIDAPDFYENKVHYLRCRWIGPGRGWVDPVKEVTAAGMRIDASISTLEDECAEQGKDWREVLEQREWEVADMRKRGLFDVPRISAKDAPGGQQPQGVDQSQSPTDGGVDEQPASQPTGTEGD